MSPASSRTPRRVWAVAFGLPVAALFLPVLGYRADEYAQVPTLFYPQYVHSVWTFSAYTFRALAGTSLIAAGLALFYPRWVRGALGPSRLPFAAFAIWLGLLAYLVDVEGHYLGDQVVQAEVRSTRRLYETVHLGLTKDAMLSLRDAVDRNISYSVADSSPYREVAGYPYLDPRPVIVLAYPAASARMRIVVEMGGDPPVPSSMATQVSLVAGRELLATKPAVSPTSNRIYRGQVSLDATADRFVSCDGRVFRVVLEPDVRKTVSGAGKHGNPVPAVLSASVDAFTLAQVTPTLRVSKLLTAGDDDDVTGRPTGWGTTDGDINSRGCR